MVFGRGLKVFTLCDNVVGVSKNRMGYIDISALNSLPEKHEYETAKFFSLRGYDVTFIKPSSIKGQHTPDFY